MGGQVTSREQELALQVVGLALDEIVSRNHFLVAATGLLEPRCVPGGAAPLSCDGRVLACDPVLVLGNFRTTRRTPVREVLHVLLHCILLHPFVGAGVDPRLWSVACDICVEGLVEEMLGAEPGERMDAQRSALRRLMADVGKSLTAERVYHALRSGSYEDRLDAWEEAFRVDDHAPWFPRDAEDAPLRQGDQLPGQSGGRTDGPAASQAETTAGESGDATGDSADVPDELPGDTMPEPMPPLSESERERLRDVWSQAAKGMRVDLETLSRTRGDRLAGLMRELQVTQHEQQDYREFLRQFAIRHEDTRLSDDEFDYVFYTYGLELYGDMPLVEPLEYRNVTRIRDFVIVLDTSSSVTNRVVQQFVDATFDVLSSTESFLEHVNVHIVQCDARVQSDTRLESLADLDRWRRNIKLHGFGGTDFRPAFRYVDELLARGEFQDLGGVIYFTDGWGIYPDRMPPYKCAFVFYDEDHRPELVPAWAIQLTLRPGEFESMSVYR